MMDVGIYVIQVVCYCMGEEFIVVIVQEYKIDFVKFKEVDEMIFW